jgi:hypothetical protein
MKVCVEHAERDDMPTQRRAHTQISGQQRLFVVLLLLLGTLLSLAVVCPIDPDAAFHRSAAPSAVSAPEPSNAPSAGE